MFEITLSLTTSCMVSLYSHERISMIVVRPPMHEMPSLKHSESHNQPRDSNKFLLQLTRETCLDEMVELARSV